MRPSPVAVDLRMDPPYDTPATAGGLPRLPINSAEPIGFESDLFVGRFQFLLRGVASCDEARFVSAKRQSWLVVQVGGPVHEQAVRAVQLAEMYCHLFYTAFQRAHC